MIALALVEEATCPEAVDSHFIGPSALKFVDFILNHFKLISANNAALIVVNQIRDGIVHIRKLVVHQVKRVQNLLIETSHQFESSLDGFNTHSFKLFLVLINL